MANRVPLCLALTIVVACSSFTEPTYFVRVSTDRVTILEGRSAEVSASASLPRGNLEAGLLTWHLSSGFTRAGEGSVVVEYRNDVHTVVRVRGFFGDSGYLVASQASSPPMDSAFVVVLPVGIATIRLDPDTLRVAVDEQGILYPVIRDSSGIDLVRASLAWSVADTAIAAVQSLSGGGASGSGRGLIRGKRPGMTTVTATVEGVTASAAVVVNSP